MTLDELNACERETFVSDLGWIVEDSPWVAERAWPRRPFGSLADLHTALSSAINAATKEEQLSLLRAHPDLGVRARLSDASTAEQSGAGLTSLSAGDFARLQELNSAYRSRFGFPFLFAVKGSSTRDILEALETRLSRPADEEFAEGLRQVCRIAWFRLQDSVK